MTTWMVVEDEPDLYEMVLAMYNLIGVDGISFTNGEDALEWIDQVQQGLIADEEIPELVLLDIRLLGEVQGIQVGYALRNTPRTSNMVIILMTAFHLNKRDEQLALLESGADILIYKPLPPLEKLTMMMENLLLSRNNPPE